nr:MAG TPA: Endodeoxyribonuclease RusA [Caudoviricetes sp.]
METHFTIPGKPQGKARPRVRRDGHAYTPSQTTQYEEFVRFCWRCAGAVMLNGAIRAVILESRTVTTSLRSCLTRSTGLPMTMIAKSRSWKYISSTGTSGMFS